MRTDKAGVLALILCGLLTTEVAIGAEAHKFFKNFFVTGGHQSAGVGLRGLGVSNASARSITGAPAGTNFASGTISISGVPAGADVVAAYLYWLTMEGSPAPSSAAGVFRGNKVIGKQLAPAGEKSCWSSGGGSGSGSGAQNLRVYRADVLRYLPVASATAPANPGRFVVNAADLAADGFAPHTVSFVDSGAGGTNSGGTANQATYTEGASLVVVYRAPNLPLRSVVIYDGGYTFDTNNPSMSLTLKGFYQASNTKPSASITYLVGDGDKNFTERLRFNGTILSDNPFQSAQSPGWDNLTYDVSSILKGGDSSVTTTLEALKSSTDCVSFAAEIFSTTVQDTDNDGLVDAWESVSGLVDPNGQPLPDLKAMGASPTVKDLFVEIDYMTTTGYQSPPGFVVAAHNHLPDRAALDRVGDAFKNAPVPPNGPGPINVHFDVGNNYQGLGDPYIIPAALARGGDAIVETACNPTTSVCQFPDYPGTIGWKAGFQALKIKYFDRNRSQSFRYGIFGHNAGRPLAKPGTPATEGIDPTKIPSSTSGIADGATGGGDFIVTLGRWDNYRGTEFMQASTLMHELGHTLGLRHGGAPGQPNCKPNYQSVMNYMNQATGLLLPKSSGGKNSSTSVSAVIDYSRQQLQSLNEGALLEQPLKTTGGASMLYLARWNVPQTSYYLNNVLRTSTVRTRHCNGTPLSEAENAYPYVRVDATSLTAPIDWNANGVTDIASYAQDLNYNGGPNSALGTAAEPAYHGFNDWLAVDLRQVAARRDANRLGIGVMPGDLDPLDPLAGAAEDGAAEDGSAEDGSATDGAAEDGSATDGAATDGAATDGGELDIDTALSISNAASALTATVNTKSIDLAWSQPNVIGNFVTIQQYKIFRATGTVSPSNLPTLLATTPAGVTTYSDLSVQNNRTYTYMVVVVFSDNAQSGPATVTATK
jgi:hypothetical protein